MPGKWQTLVVFLTAIAVANACPYCPPTDSTLSEKLAESRVACVVKFLESKNGEELSQQTTTFEVVNFLKKDPALKTGPTIVTTFGQTGKKGDLFLLLGQMKEDEMEWILPIPIDELGSEVNYIRKAPSPEVRPESERLLYFLKYLDSKNQTISNDAFGEFSRAKFEDVEQLAPKLKRDDVRRWLEDPNPQLDVRRAFYGMLLGLCGNNEDATYLEKKILAPIDPGKNRLGIEGMMGGYLMLRGQQGLKTLIEKKIDSLPAKLASNDPRIVDLNGFRMTLSFLWDYRRSQFTEEPLRAAMRRYLDRPEFADLAIIHLAQWKDWRSLDQLISAYGHAPWETRSGKEKIVAFALSCRKDAPAGSDAQLPAHAIKAQKFLDSLDPEFVQSVKRSPGGPIPVPETTDNTKPGTRANRDDGG